MEQEEFLLGDGLWSFLSGASLLLPLKIRGRCVEI